MPTELPELLTIEDLCNLLRVSKPTILRLRKNEVKVMDDQKRPLVFPEPKIMLGRSPRWDKVAFELWLNQSIQ